MSQRVELIKKYFPELNDKKIERLDRLASLMEEKNKEVNIISRKDIENLIEHHFLPALAITKAKNFLPGESILDIGTGGGLPGLPLAVSLDKCSFCLIDSVGKKIRVVAGITQELGVRNVEAVQVRSNEFKRSFDRIIGRGVTDPATFFRLAKKNLKDKGVIIYISGNSDYTEAKRIPLSDFFPGEYFQNKFIYISE
jgi:16S rRNA (guanine527-N7)-methyltransferase